LVVEFTGPAHGVTMYIYIYMRVVIYCDIALYIKLSLLGDLLIPLTLLTDFLLFCVFSFSGTGKRGNGDGETGTGKTGTGKRGRGKRALFRFC
jgi:hypothetical protein